MDIRPTGQGHLKAIRRSLVEVLFIIFLFYANLLMGEFTRTAGHGQTIWAAVKDIFNGATCAIALLSSVIGYMGFEYARKRL